MVIPREGDKVRLYIQLDKQVLDAATGRVDKSRVSADHLLQVGNLSCLFRLSRAAKFRCRQSRRSSGLTPSTPERSNGGRFTSVHRALYTTLETFFLTIIHSRSTSRVKVLHSRARFYRRRCLPHPLSQGWTGYECQHERYPQPQ